MAPTNSPALRVSLLVLPLLFAACPPASTVKPTADADSDAAKGRPVAVLHPVMPADPGASASDGDAEAIDRLRNLPPLYFALDSAQLQSESQEVLNEVADVLRRKPHLKLKIEGHTCELGTAEYNLALGLRRAQVAREYLVRLGVPSRVVETISFGEERPAEEEAHAQNRRSELRIDLASQASVSR